MHLQHSQEKEAGATRLADIHKDPADRLIVATARIYDLTILTSDHKILDYPHGRSLASR
jgi:PIN domain nuclease of toxin-antitoxin system